MESLITDETSARDFLIHVAAKINKKPADVEKFIEALESNWIENVAAIKQVDDDQWKSLGIPMGLVNQIKNNLKTVGQPAATEPASQQINSSSAGSSSQGKNITSQLKSTANQRAGGKSVPVAQISLGDTDT